MEQTEQPVEQPNPVPWPQGTATPDQEAASLPAQRDREAWGSGHLINLRFTIPLFFCGIYVTLVAGKERRDRDRRRLERLKHPLATFGNLLFMYYSATVLVLAIAAVLLIAAGIYILQENHVKVTIW